MGESKIRTEKMWSEMGVTYSIIKILENKMLKWYGTVYIYWTKQNESKVCYRVNHRANDIVIQLWYYKPTSAERREFNEQTVSGIIE